MRFRVQYPTTSLTPWLRWPLTNSREFDFEHDSLTAGPTKSPEAEHVAADAARRLRDELRSISESSRPMLRRAVRETLRRFFETTSGIDSRMLDDLVGRLADQTAAWVTLTDQARIVSSDTDEPQFFLILRTAELIERFVRSSGEPSDPDRVAEIIALLVEMTSPKILLRHVTQPHQLAAALASPGDSSTRLVAGRLTDLLRTELVAATRGGLTVEDSGIIDRLVGELNDRVIYGPLLWDPDRWSQVRLSLQTLQEARKPLTGITLARMNRRLLSVAFPGILKDLFEFRSVGATILYIERAVRGRLETSSIPAMVGGPFIDVASRDTPLRSTSESESAASGTAQPPNRWLEFAQVLGRDRALRAWFLGEVRRRIHWGWDDIAAFLSKSGSAVFDRIQFPAEVRRNEVERSFRRMAARARRSETPTLSAESLRQFYFRAKMAWSTHCKHRTSSNQADSATG